MSRKTGRIGQGILVFPMDDIGAKKIFQEEEVRRRFISAVLSIPLEEIRSTRLLNTHLLRRFRRDKEGIVDIIIELNDDTKIIIEIQVEKYKNWDGRNLYYLSKAFIEGVGTGEDYKKLKKCVSISVLDFNYLQTEKRHSHFMWRDEEGNIYTDLLEIHIIEINKLPGDSVTKEDEAINEWIALFQCRKEEELEMLKTRTSNPGILTAIEVLREMSLSKAIKEEWEYRQKQRRDRHAREEFVYDSGVSAGRELGLEQGIEQGIEKGMEQGVEQGKVTAARNLLDILEPSVIAERVGLPIEQVMCLKEEAEYSIEK